MSSKGEMLDFSVFKKYLNSSEIQDRIGLGKTLERKCEAEMIELWYVLIIFEWKCSSDFPSKRLPRTHSSSNMHFPDIVKTVERGPSIDPSLDGDEHIFKKTIELYSELIRRIDSHLTEQLGGIKEVVVQKSKDIKRKETAEKKKRTQNEKVFLRGVQRKQRLERKTQSELAAPKIEVSLKRKVWYLAADLKKVLSETITQYIGYVDSKDLAIEKLLKALYYQTNYLE